MCHGIVWTLPATIDRHQIDLVGTQEADAMVKDAICVGNCPSCPSVDICAQKMCDFGGIMRSEKELRSPAATEGGW